MKASPASRLLRLVSLCLAVLILVPSVFASGEPGVGPRSDSSSVAPIALSSVAEVTTSLRVNGEAYAGGDLTVHYGDTFVLGINWKLSNDYAIQSGDIFTYSLPADGLCPKFEAVSGTLLNGGNAVGSYAFSEDGALTLMYDNVSSGSLGGRSNVTGGVEIEGRFDYSSGFINQPYTKLFDIGEGSARLVLEQSGGSGDLAIDKADPLPVSDGEYRWVVMVRSEGTNTNVVLQDTMGEYLSLPAGVEPIVTRAGLDAVWVPDAASAWSAAEQAQSVSRSAYACSTTDRGFTLRFSQLAEGVYYIRYESGFDHKSALDHAGAASSASKCTNTASVFSDQITEPLTSSSGISLSKNWINKNGVFLSPGVIEWTITVNGAPVCDIGGYYLKDVPGSGQEYRSGTLRLDGELLPDSDWSLMQSGQWQFPAGIAQSEHAITYQVSVTAPEDTYFSNTAMIGPAADDMPNSAHAEIDAFTRNYILKDGGRDALLGVLEWGFKLRDVTAAFASSPITVTDTLPLGTEFVDGSVTVQSGSGSVYMAQQAINRDIDRFIIVEKLGTDDAGRQQIRLTITSELLQSIVDWSPVSWNDDAQAIVSYKTKITRQDADVESYTNSFAANHADWTEITGSAAAEHTSHDYVTKSAEYNSHTAPYVNYTVIVNPEAYKTEADSITVTDELGTALSLALGSLKVYEPGSLLDIGGTVTDATDADDTEITGYAYDYDFDTRTLTIQKLPGDRALKITYQCLLELAEGETLTDENANNIVRVSGATEEIETTEAPLYGKALRPSGVTSGNYAGVTLYKHASEDVTHPLSDAHFTLEDLFVDRTAHAVTGVRDSQEQSTGETGYIHFSNLHYDHLYRVSETQAPDGYAKGEDVYYVVFEGNDGFDWANTVLADENGDTIPLVKVVARGVNNVNLNIENEMIAAPDPTQSPTPVITPSPTFEPGPTQSPAPVITPSPTFEPGPTQTPAPVITPSPTYTPGSTPAPAGGSASNSSSASAPKTGDSGLMVPCLTASIIAFAASLSVIYLRVRRRTRENRR